MKGATSCPCLCNWLQPDIWMTQPLIIGRQALGTEHVKLESGIDGVK